MAEQPGGQRSSRWPWVPACPAGVPHSTLLPILTHFTLCQAHSAWSGSPTSQVARGTWLHSATLYSALSPILTQALLLQALLWITHTVPACRVLYNLTLHSVPTFCHSHNVQTSSQLLCTQFWLVGSLSIWSASLLQDILFHYVRSGSCGPECDEYIRIFEYSNILVMNIYSDIRSYQFFFYEYIQTFVRVKFVCTNIFGHSLVSVLECKT